MPTITTSTLTRLEHSLKDEITRWRDINPDIVKDFLSVEWFNQSSIAQCLLRIQLASQDKSLNFFAQLRDMDLDSASYVRAFQIEAAAKILVSPYARMHIQALNEFNEEVDSFIHQEMSYAECFRIYVKSCQTYGSMISNFIDKISKSKQMADQFAVNEFEVLTSPAKLKRRGNDSQFWHLYELEIKRTISNAMNTNFNKAIAALILFPTFTSTVTCKLKYMDSMFYVTLLPPILTLTIYEAFPNKRAVLECTKEDRNNLNTSWYKFIRSETAEIISNFVFLDRDGSDVVEPIQFEDEHLLDQARQSNGIDKVTQRKRMNTVDSAICSVLGKASTGQANPDDPTTPILETIGVTSSPIESGESFDYSTYNPNKPTEIGRWIGTGKRKKWISKSPERVSNESGDSHSSIFSVNDFRYHEPDVGEQLYVRTSELIAKLTNDDGAPNIPNHVDRFSTKQIGSYAIRFEELQDNDILIKLTNCERSMRFIVTIEGDMRSFVFTRVLKHRWDRFT